MAIVALLCLGRSVWGDVLPDCLPDCLPDARPPTSVAALIVPVLVEVAEPTPTLKATDRDDVWQDADGWYWWFGRDRRTPHYWQGRDWTPWQP